MRPAQIRAHVSPVASYLRGYISGPLDWAAVGRAMATSEWGPASNKAAEWDR